MGESRETEVCWYLTGTREQFRLSGVLDMITPEHSDPAKVNTKRALCLCPKVASRVYCE